MPLPGTIGSITIPSSWTFGGPFNSAGGNRYWVGRASADATQVQMVKSTDGGVNWSTIGTNPDVGASSIIGMSVTQDGQNIHVCTVSGSDASMAVHYHAFSMATDSWTTSAQSVSSGVDATGANMLSGIAVRSDGDIVLVHAGATTKVKGSNYYTLVYDYYNGSWNTANALDDGGAVQYIYGAVTLGASDKVHFTYTDVTNTNRLHKSLSSDYATLSSAEALNDNAAATNARGGMAYYDASGTERITGVWIRSSNSHTVTAEVDADGTPGAEESASGTGSTDPRITIDAANDTAWVVYTNTSDSDLYATSNANSGGWDTPTSVYTGTVTSLYSVNFFNDLVGITFAEGGSIKYDEFATTTAVTINASAGVADTAGQSATVTPGAVSVGSTAGTLVSSGQSATVTSPIPPQTVTATATTLGSSGQSGSVIPGAISVSCTASTAAISGQTSSIVPGAVTVTCTEGTAVVSGQPSTVSNVVTVQASVGSAALSGEPSSIIPGEVVVSCGAGTVASAGQTTAVSNVVTVQTSTGTAAFSGESSSVVPGAVVVQASAGSLASTGQTATAGALVSVDITAGQLISTGIAASVTPGAVSVSSLAGSSLFSGQASAVVPGEVVVQLVSASLVSAGQASAIVPGSITVQTSSGTILATGSPASIVAAGASLTVNCSAGGITAAGQSVQISVDLQITASFGLITAAGQPLTVIPGEATVVTASGVVLVEGQPISLILGGASISAVSGTVASSALSGSVIPGEVLIAAVVEALNSAGFAATLTPGGVSVSLLSGTANFAGIPASVSFSGFHGLVVAQITSLFGASASVSLVFSVVEGEEPNNVGDVISPVYGILAEEVQVFDSVSEELPM